MPSAHLSLREAEVVKMVLEFLDNRRLHISQLSLERETGVINGRHSDDMLFLRQLILDGQWDDVLEFVQPLEGIDGFDSRRFKYVVCRHKYEELLCIRSEVMQSTTGSMCSQEVDVAVDEMVKCLDDMERLAPSRDEYSSLCLLLTLPRLTDHPEYREWNPSSARVECFKTIHPLVDKYLPTTAPQHHPAGSATSKGGAGIKSGSHGHFATAKNDRLVQLIIKGALYESCVEFCQQKATGTGGGITKASHDSVQFSGLLDNDGSKGFTDADLSLPSWLQSIPHDIFACPFEQRTLNVDVEALQRPDLEASWTEHILVTPIKPKTFPHSAMPTNARPSSTAAAAAAGLMSRSLNPQLDGLPFGLAASQRYLMALSVGDVSCMSKSFAGFHLTGKKSMSTSVDKLFEGLLDKTSSDVLNASSYYGDLPAVLNDKVAAAAADAVVAAKCSTANGQLRTPIVDTNVIVAHTKYMTAGHEQEGVDTVDRLSDKDPSASPALLVGGLVGASDSTQLYKEYQRQKLKIQEDLANQERRRDEYLKQLMEIEVGQEIMAVADNRLCEDQDKSHLMPSHLHQQRHFLNPMCASTPKQSIVAPSLEPSASSKHPTGGSCSSSSSSSSASNCTQKRCVMDASSLCTPLDSSAVVLQGGSTPLGVRAYNVQPSQQQYSRQDNLPPQSQPRAKHGFISPNRTVNVATTTSGGSHSSNGSAGQQQQVPGPKPKFIPVTSLEDVQAIRAAEFHPSGKLYAIGSNSKTLRVCAYPRMTDLREDHETHQPTVLFKRTRHHKGSIYCLAWNATGDLLATGSNDKTVRLMRFNAETCNVEGDDIELSMHDGTVRDVCFVEDLSNKSSLLISGGAGDCKIYVTDCVTGTPFQAMSGHSGHILALYTWGGAMFVSGSQDRTIRFWDLRTRGCVNVIPSPPPNGSAAIKGSAVATVAVDPSGRMLVSGQEDASCMLYDIRGNRIIQCFKPHTSDIRTIRFSPKAYYLLSGSYDNKVVLTDLQGDLTLPLPSLVVSEHQDKVIQCRWHPTDFAYLSTSADKTATLWGLPPN